MADEINQFRAFNQQYQLILAQKQRLGIQAAELQNAMEDLDKATGKVFFATGTILIEGTKEDVKKKLETQKKEAEEREGILAAQEEKLKKKLNELQKKIQEKSSESA